MVEQLIAVLLIGSGGNEYDLQSRPGTFARRQYSDLSRDELVEFQKDFELGTDLLSRGRAVEAMDAVRKWSSLKDNHLPVARFYADAYMQTENWVAMLSASHNACDLQAEGDVAFQDRVQVAFGRYMNNFQVKDMEAYFFSNKKDDPANPYNHFSKDIPVYFSPEFHKRDVAVVLGQLELSNSSTSRVAFKGAVHFAPNDQYANLMYATLMQEVNPQVAYDHFVVATKGSDAKFKDQAEKGVNNMRRRGAGG